MQQLTIAGFACRAGGVVQVILDFGSDFRPILRSAHLSIVEPEGYLHCLVSTFALAVAVRVISGGIHQLDIKSLKHCCAHV